MGISDKREVLLRLAEPLEGMDSPTARLLASKGVKTQEDLAELALDDLVELTDMDAERAKALIMAARAPWFA